MLPVDAAEILIGAVDHFGCATLVVDASAIALTCILSFARAEIMCERIMFANTVSTEFILSTGYSSYCEDAYSSYRILFLSYPHSTSLHLRPP